MAVIHWHCNLVHKGQPDTALARHHEPSTVDTLNGIPDLNFPQQLLSSQDPSADLAGHTANTSNSDKQDTRCSPPKSSKARYANGVLGRILVEGIAVKRVKKRLTLTRCTQTRIFVGHLETKPNRTFELEVTYFLNKFNYFREIPMCA